jgi:hypothetical protein
MLSCQASHGSHAGQRFLRLRFCSIDATCTQAAHLHQLKNSNALKANDLRFLFLGADVAWIGAKYR